MPVTDPSVVSGAKHEEKTPLSDASQTMAVFDFDGTLTYKDTFVRFLYLVLAEHKARLAACWELPLDVTRYMLGWRDNSWLKQRFMHRILRGLTDSDLSPIGIRLRNELLHRGFRPGAITELKRRTELGHRRVLLSAGLDIYLVPIARHLGFSDCVCSIAERDGRGALTGRLLGANCHGAEKVRRLEALIGQKRAAWHIVAYGDSAADLALMEAVDEGFLVNASGTLARKAAAIRAQVIQW